MEGIPHPESERTMAALAHASTLLNLFAPGIGGPIAALIIWQTHKEQSAWVSFQGLQSLVFQVIQLAVILLLVGGSWTLGFIFSFATIGFGTLLAVPMMILTFFLGAALSIAGLAYSLYGAYQVYQGRDFKYIWAGSWAQHRI
jgi:uncharacterized Tic20 family protein